MNMSDEYGLIDEGYDTDDYEETSLQLSILRYLLNTPETDDDQEYFISMDGDANYFEHYWGNDEQKAEEKGNQERESIICFAVCTIEPPIVNV
jgi:hypothetical protein